MSHRGTSGTLEYYPVRCYQFLHQSVLDAVRSHFNKLYDCLFPPEKQIKPGGKDSDRFWVLFLLRIQHHKQELRHKRLNDDPSYLLLFKGTGKHNQACCNTIFPGSNPPVFPAFLIRIRHHFHVASKKITFESKQKKAGNGQPDHSGRLDYIRLVHHTALALWDKVPQLRFLRIFVDRAHFKDSLCRAKGYFLHP
jgi:hypothetical protein